MKKTVQVVLINELKEVLCVSRKDNHNDFGLPGGKMDDTDTDEIFAAKREVKEETGLDIDNLKLVYVKHENGGLGFTYLADYTGEINYDEPHVVKWGSFSDLIKGSFGKWNNEVLESLIDMSVVVNHL